MKFQIQRFVATVCLIYIAAISTHAFHSPKNGESFKEVDICSTENPDSSEEEALAIVCPPDVVAYVGDDCIVFVNIPGPMSDDPLCPIVSATNNTGLLDPSGNYTVTNFNIIWNVLDACGVSMICVQNVSVLDTIKPTFTPPADITIGCFDAPDDLTLTGEPTDLMDNCPGMLQLFTSDTGMPGSCDGEIIINRRWAVVDASGNTTNHVQVITQTDDTPPIAVCQDITVQLDDMGRASIVASDLDGGSSDECSMNLMFTVDKNLFLCIDIPSSPVPVTLTVSDECGNMSDCIANVTIEDPFVATMTCPGPLMGICDISEHPPYATLQEFLDAGGTYDDNCDADPTTFMLVSEASVGTCPTIVTREYSVGAIGGGVVSCMQTITIDDNILPVLTCPADINQLVDLGLCTATVTVPVLIIDENCGLQSVVNDFNGMPDASGVYPLGETTVTWTVTDLCGNVATCSVVVDITEDIDPILNCPPTAMATCDISEQPPFATLMELTDAGGSYSDNCSPEPILFELISDVSDGMTCPETVTRIYQVTDSEGNTGTCEHVVIVDDNIDPVFDSAPTPIVPNSISCDTDFPVREELTASDNCGIMSLVIDTIFTEDICAGYGVIYQWTATDFCGNSSVEFTSFTVEPDTTPPVLDCSEISQGTDDDVCEAFVNVPDPTVSDNCSTWTAVNDRTGTDDASGIYPLGSTIINWTVTDACGNESMCTQTITVFDDQGPDIVCNNDIVIALGGSGTGVLNAAQVLLSVTDNCNVLGTVLIRRLETGGGPCNIVDNDVFGPTVSFCCADADQEIMVELIAYDGYGNPTLCMVGVDIEDNLAPSIISCPTDITLSCEFPIDTSDLSGFGTIVFDPADVMDITVNDDFYAPTYIAGQDGLATDNCSDGLSLTESVSGDLECRQGVFVRTFVVSDASGNTTSCSQNITIIDFDPFEVNDITWPPDFTFTDCTMVDPNPDDTGRPILDFDNCSLVAATYTDQTFSNPLSGCSLIKRTWKVIDWCQFESNSMPPVGLWTYVQDITVESLEAPEFLTGCEDVTICNSEAFCYANVSISATAEDECTVASELTWWYNIDLDSDGSIDINNSGNSINQTMNFGTHTVTWYVEDRCGNVNNCQQVLEVKDCKSPTAICYNGLAIALMPMNGGGMIQIWAEDFNNHSSDNCTSDTNLEFSFSSDITDKTRTYTCDDEGIQTVQMWVTDEFGNQSFCETFVDIQDNDNICPDQKVFAAVAGRVMTEDNVFLEETKVLVDSEDMDDFDMTDESGDYMFEALPMHHEYTISPEKDDDVLNGVSTLDLVLIQKHILSFEILDSPYKLIAADINANDEITAIDLVELRKVILGIHETFPSNEVWRFVDAAYEFPLPNEPWGYPEEITLEDLDENQMYSDFVGVKIGDVNSSVEFNLGNEEAEVRSQLNFSFTDVDFVTNEEVVIDVYADSEKALMAFQTSWMYNHDALEYVEVRSGSIEIHEQQVADLETTKGTLNMAWHNVTPAEINKNELLFSLVFKSKERGVLSQTVNFNQNGFNTIAYDEQLNEVDLGLNIIESSTNFVLHQNKPNPFTDQTQISFELEEASEIELSIYEVSGKNVMVKKGSYESGKHSMMINSSDLQTSSGVLYCKLQVRDKSIIHKMILIK